MAENKPHVSANILKIRVLKGEISYNVNLLLINYLSFLLQMSITLMSL